jgi:formylglycine-generating enzyme required for sulfatase activity
MHGNVREWVQDRFAKHYYKQRWNPDSDPQGSETGARRVVRGGSYLDNQRAARCSFRGWSFSCFGPNNVGFRIVVHP